MTPKPLSMLPWEAASLNSLLLSTKNSEVLLPWRWLLGWRGWLLATQAWVCQRGQRVPRPRAPLPCRQLQCPVMSRLLWGFPAGPPLGRGPRHGEESKALGSPCLA